MMKKTCAMIVAGILLSVTGWAQEEGEAAVAASSGWSQPSEEAIRGAAVDTDKLAMLLKGASPEQAVSVAGSALQNIEESMFPETIKKRLVETVAIATAVAGDDAPQVASDLVNRVKNEHFPLAVATSVLVAGEHADAVKQSIYGAVDEGKQDVAKEAAQHPIDLVLGVDLARAAVEAAQRAMENIESASSAYFDLPRRPRGGLPGEEFIPRGEFYFGQTIFDSFTGRFVRPTFVFTNSLGVPEVGGLGSAEEVRSTQTLPFDNGFVDNNVGRFAGRFDGVEFRPGTSADTDFGRVPGADFRRR